VANITVTTAANFIPELWAAQIQETLHKNLVLAPLFDRQYRAGIKLGDTIHVPNLAEIAAADKAASTDVTYTANTETVVDILINKHKYAAVKIEDIADTQAQYDLRENYTREISRSVAQAIDTELATTIDDFSQTVGTLIVELTDDNIIRAVQYLDDANAPLEDRCIGISPAQKAGFLKLDKFVHVDYRAAIGGLTANKGRGYWGNIYGCDVYVSTNIEGSNALGHDNGMWQREAVAIVMQMEPKVVSEYSVDSLAWKLVCHSIFGYKEMRDTCGVWLKGA